LWNSRIHCTRACPGGWTRQRRWALGILIYELLVGFPPFFGELNKIYEAIVRYKPPTKDLFENNPEGDEIEAALRLEAKNLIIELLRKDKTKRLGCLHGGVDDIKNHRFFAGVNWTNVENGTMNAPIIPDALAPEDIPATEPEENEEPPSESKLEEGDPSCDRAAFVDF